MFSRSRASVRYRFRGHRARSVELTQSELVEIRAAQRTFEGAYTRTALSQFSFALVVLKIFTHEFYPIGALFAVFGFCILGAASLRRRHGNKQFFRDGESRRFRTSGTVVTLVTCISVAAYAVLLVLILKMDG
ncbi:hypothetical protein FPQ18DRAFT_382345 [Pyronema domesticum]|uniref:DUF202 domain-containing protein n=1 Tax=Pyronema omphalodes (strain CBS 100304) TaxID=1076935 RepID=U4KWC9_PYROM|nr:hypothetical protein FPQ18DRAFT_382345 [Pyronema domesticum]CCX05396.1 Similar to hypothetical protein [Tuber melanosporum Mel28]; acc. no. XP_002836637 [Pyronema omphalodes CBS 100304]